MSVTIKWILLLVVLLPGCQVAMGQSVKGEVADKVIRSINEGGYRRPALFWLEDDERAGQYLSSMHDFSIQSMKDTKDEVDGEWQEAQQILDVKKLIVGKTKKVKKQNKRLAKYFKDVDAARRAFEEAAKLESRCRKMSAAIGDELACRVAPVMPSGHLSYFHYRSTNGFAGYLKEVTLSKKDGKGWLRIEERRRMRMVPEDEEADKEPEVIEVDDSVFQRVRDMAEEGKLYEAGHRYQPDYMITDASSWSMEFKFEGGAIDSSGYATGPDNARALGRILDYLEEVYKNLL